MVHRDDAPTTVDLTGDSDDDDDDEVVVEAPAPAPTPRKRRRAGATSASGDAANVCVILDSPPRGNNLVGVDGDSGGGGGGGGGVQSGVGTAVGTGIKCVICMDVIGIKNMASTVCGHVFCAECIAESLKASKKCPTCRKSLRVTQVHRLYV